MRYALYLPNFGEFADVHALADLALEAEQAGWDGLCPIASGRTVSPEEVHEMLTSLMQQRTTDAPFDVAVAGSVGNRAPAEAAQLLKAYADAGVTWWLESFVPKDTLDDVHKRIHQGSPTF